ncbi:PREDICTED: uncharacterized protein LOC105570885, partial [Vollenhovia emeryi]|uniref:uncharacterized protein LOC105570885 n=1 Tax=Vollenhovia emeryi TaxID=411798 RepID=UPI0005F53F71
MASEQDITALKRRRAVILGACTRTKTFVESLEIITPSIAAQLEERRTKLNDNWSEYQNVQLQIETLDKGESTHRNDFENAFYTLAARIRELLVPQVLPRSETTPSPSLSNVSEIPRATTHVRLPKLELPVFSGKYEEWTPFFDAFQSIIHANASINERSNFKIPQNIKLADPQFNISSDIDILIGAELFWSVLCVGQIKASVSHPLLQKTRFGWILAGRLGEFTRKSQKIQSLHASITNSQLHEQLTRFWQLESMEDPNTYTSEEVICEKHFSDNVARNQQGRYIVKLPFRELAKGKIGNSKEIALKRLLSLERRFTRNPQLKVQYTQFLREYLALGHMRQITTPGELEGESYYLPHHCVFKNSQAENKIRVVFDASAKSSSGSSLNDVLMTGPVVQQDLWSILIRFRTFVYVFTADIIKMYRQILMHSEHTPYQRILWREEPNSEIKVYELLTVTYGTSSASFLATRCLKHLAETNRHNYPVGSICVIRDSCVDDILSGADTIVDAKIARDETISLLRSGGFELSKWSSNCPELLNGIQDQNNDPVIINSQMDSRILGMHWNQSQDTFYFSYNPSQTNSAISKRVILSEVARLFDPLGLLGPIIVLAKLILQELWNEGIHWDESVPQDINYRWTELKSQLPNINELQIPRCIKPGEIARFTQIHGFCDASQRAFGACAYLRTQTKDGFHCELICSKSRIAPTKAVSLPRLELAAALLLARLIDKLKASTDMAN